jgi:beta-lactamase class A
MVSSAFGLDPLAHTAPDRGLDVRCKTRTNTGVRSEVGVVHGSRTSLAYAVTANWDDSAADTRDDVLAAMRAIGTGLRERCLAGPAN